MAKIFIIIIIIISAPSYLITLTQEVDAGSVVLTPVTLSSSVTIATIACDNDVITPATVDCDVTTCTVTSSVSSVVTAGSELVCVLTVSFLSHQTRYKTANGPRK